MVLLEKRTELVQTFFIAYHRRANSLHDKWEEIDIVRTVDLPKIVVRISGRWFKMDLLLDHDVVGIEKSQSRGGKPERGLSN